MINFGDVMEKTKHLDNKELLRRKLVRRKVILFLNQFSPDSDNSEYDVYTNSELLEAVKN